MKLEEAFDDFARRKGFEPLAGQEAAVLRAVHAAVLAALEPSVFEGLASLRVLYAFAAAAYLFCAHSRSEATGVDVGTVDAARLFWELSGAPQLVRRADGSVYGFEAARRLAAARRALTAAAERDLPRLRGEVWAAEAAVRRAAAEPPEEAFPLPDFEAFVVRLARDDAVAAALWGSRQS